MLPRVDSLDCYNYSPSGRRMNADDDTPSSSSSCLSTPDDNSNHLFDFLFVVGPDVSDQEIEFLGVLAEVPVKVLSVESASSHTASSPIVGNIAKFAFEKPTAEVVKLESIHAAHRYLRTEEVDSSDFFAFTVNKQSVRRSSLAGRGESCFCFCMPGIELVPLDSQFPGYTAVVPVRYIIVSERPFVDLFFQLLKILLRDRLACMKQYWSTGQLKRSCWFAQSSYISSLTKSLLGSPWCPPSSSLHYDPIPISVSRPPAWGVEKIYEKSEFCIAWFTIPLVRQLTRPVVFSLVAACLLELKVMIISSSQSRRANAVIGLLGIVSDTLRWPHPVLASPPSDIACELPNAPTPVIAALPVSKKYSKPDHGGRRLSSVFKKRTSIDSSRNGANENCLFLNLDDSQMYWFNSAVGDAVSRSAAELEQIPVESISVSPDRLAWIQAQTALTGSDPDEVSDLVTFIETVKAKVSLVVGDVASSVKTKLETAASFGDACALAEKEMGPSDLKRGLLRSQAFELLLE